VFTGTRPALRPYAELLLRLAVRSPDAASLDACRKLIDDDVVDWAAFVDAAGRHKILPLLSKHIVRNRLERGGGGDGTHGIPYFWLYPYVYRANRDRNEALADEFVRVVTALREAGLRYAVRKGFVLAEHAYGDIGARRINDVDLLIERADAPRAHDVLVSLGYEQGRISRDGDHIEPFDRQTQIFWRVNLSNQLPYVKPGGREDIPIFNVDLCHDIFQRKSGAEAPTARLLDRAIEAPLCGDTAFILSPEDHLLDLCSHLHKEATSLLFIKEGVDLQLSKFLDLAVTCETHDAASWQLFVERAREYRAEEIAYYSLYFTDLLYPGRVPVDVLADLRPADVSYLDEFGTLDGHTERRDLGFPERLFAFDRRFAGTESVVPGGVRR
jgi:hypothetical protein